MVKEYLSQAQDNYFSQLIRRVLRSFPYRFFLAVVAMMPIFSFGQEIDFDSLLQRVDTIENPVYKPVLTFSYGVLNFHGDVKNSLSLPVTGNHAGQVNVATFIDRKNHYFIANFNFMLGRMSGNEYSYEDLTRNLNFKTDLYSIGFNAEYRFGHFIPSASLVRPYVFLGLENINFSAKGDLEDSNENTYNYWSDGTIRDLDETTADPSQANIIYRDYLYETDLRSRERNVYQLGNYSQSTIGIPFGLGLHFRIDRRAFFSLGMSYHYTFSDVLDNVSSEGTHIKGAKGNDGFIFSHLSLQFDLFSDPATKTVDLMFADVEFDPLFYDDEDGDFVLDVTDRCPGTPYGVEVDTLGCPLDTDMDGVPDYLDKEPATAREAWVDEEGVTITEDEFLTELGKRNEAMERGDVSAYMDMIRGEYRVAPAVEIPDRFKPLDENGDSYISFEELLKTVDLYFDYQLDLSLEELRELNQFFFSQ